MHPQTQGNTVEIDVLMLKKIISRRECFSKIIRVIHDQFAIETT
jgi:hypothetical protein